MGRPPITLSPDQVHEVETLAALLSVQQIADYLGIARSTFFALLERDPDIARRYRRGKAKAIAHVANSLLQKARSGDTTSMLFYLKTQAGWRETAALEVMAPDAADLVIAGSMGPVVLEAEILAAQAIRLGIDQRLLGLVGDPEAGGQ